MNLFHAIEIAILYYNALKHMIQQSITIKQRRKRRLCFILVEGVSADV